MTDPLTDAVRRLKQLQQDVERLQSAEDEEGEPRLFFTTEEQARADDDLAIGPTELRGDRVLARSQTRIIRNDIRLPDIATAADIQEDLRLKQLNDDGFWNNIGYLTSSYNVGSTVRSIRPKLRATDVAVAAETIIVSAARVNALETAAGVDTTDTTGGTVQPATYNSASYQTNTYQ